MNYESMSDFEINKAVAERRGGFGGSTNNEYAPDEVICYDDKPFYTERDYCNNPSDAWPIIVENRISISPYEEDCQGWFSTTDASFFVDDENPLRAAMVAYLMMQEAK